MNQSQYHYLRGLALGELRKKELSLSKFRAKPGQPEADADVARESLTEKITFVRDAIAALDTVQRERVGA